MGLATAGKIVRSKVIEVVTESYLLKAKLKLSKNNLALEQRIGLAKESLKSVSTKTISLRVLHLALICLCKTE